MTKLCYQALSISAFTTLQKRVFPTYFRLQTGLLLLTAATCPPLGLFSVARSLGYFMPLTLGGATALMNLEIYGPRTQDLMVKRIHQGTLSAAELERSRLISNWTETNDGRKFNDAEQSPEMKIRNREFAKAHAMSIHLNLLTILATIWYGFSLTSRFQLDTR